MMVLHRAKQKIEHRQFRELKAFLQLGDLLVLNDTRVLAARRFSDNGAVEFLFLERLGPTRWKCMVTPGRKIRVGATAMIDDVRLRVEEITADGERIVAFDKDVDVYAGGSMPLPPYVNRLSDESDAARYQTVFAVSRGRGCADGWFSYFTSEILVNFAHVRYVACRTGNISSRALGNIAEHRMHAERFSISPEAADKINNGQRIVAVGTTAMRVLETATRKTKLLSRQIQPQ